MECVSFSQEIGFINLPNIEAKKAEKKSASFVDIKASEFVTSHLMH